MSRRSPENIGRRRIQTPSDSPEDVGTPSEAEYFAHGEPLSLSPGGAGRGLGGGSFAPTVLTSEGLA